VLGGGPQPRPIPDALLAALLKVLVDQASPHLLHSAQRLLLSLVPFSTLPGTTPSHPAPTPALSVPQLEAVCHACLWQLQPQARPGVALSILPWSGSSTQEGAALGETLGSSTAEDRGRYACGSLLPSQQVLASPKC